MATANELSLTFNNHSVLQRFVSPEPAVSERFSDLLHNPDTLHLRKTLAHYRDIFFSSRLLLTKFGSSYSDAPRVPFYGNMGIYLEDQFEPHDVNLPVWHSLAFDLWKTNTGTLQYNTPQVPSVIYGRNGDKRHFVPCANPIEYTPNENVKILVGQWPFNAAHGDTALHWVDPNLLHALISHEIDADWRPTVKAVKVMTDAGLFLNLPGSINIMSFISERLLLNISLFQPGKFSNFMIATARQIGGKAGYSAAALIIENLISIYSPDNSRIPQGKEYLKELTDTLDILFDEFSQLKYSERDAAIADTELVKVTENPTRLWEPLYSQYDIQTAVESLLGKNDERSRSILASLSLERKIIPGLVLLTAQALGLDYDSAKDLAARAFFAWGVILAFDNVLDEHLVRKGQPTDIALEGYEKSLDHTMISFIQFTRQSLGNNHLTERMLEMMQTSFEGELESRNLGWENSLESYFTAAEKMVSAFSWFGEYIGETTGRLEAGRALGEFIAKVNTIGQISNDVEDLNPGNKHEPLHDITNRISIFWRAFMGLSDETVEAGVKDFVRTTYDNALKSKTLDPQDSIKMQKIGLEYKTQVAESFITEVNLLASEAQWFLYDAFTYLPMDESNTAMITFFKAMIEEAVEKFTVLGLPLPQELSV